MAKMKFKLELQRPLALVGGGLSANMVTNFVEQNVPQAAQYPYIAPAVTFLLGMYLDQNPPGKGPNKELIRNVGQGMLVSGGIDLASVVIPGMENMLGDVINNPFTRTDRTKPFRAGITS